MSRDLQAQLTEYGQQMREDLPVLDSDDVMVRGGSPVILGGRDVSVTPRRRGLLVTAAAFLVVILIGLFQLLGSTPSEVVDVDPAAPPSDPDLFEPIRGWIVYTAGRNLRAVDPDDPTSQRTIELPTNASGSSPLGWSTDGSKLLLLNERIGNWHVMDNSGETLFHGPTGGCCLFVGTNTMSPDGRYHIRSFDVGGLTVDALAGGEPRRIVDMSRFEDLIGRRDAIWSPDGTEIAFVGVREDGMTVMVASVDNGAVRELVDARTGYIRHLTWSPDGTEILVTASPEAVDPDFVPLLNPLLRPVATSLTLVQVDGSGRREIASGHYVAAAWSPDGSQIAALDYPSDRNITVMNRNGSGLHVLAGVEPSGPFTGIAWHPAP